MHEEQPQIADFGPEDENRGINEEETMKQKREEAIASLTEAFTEADLTEEDFDRIRQSVTERQARKQ